MLRTDTNTLDTAIDDVDDRIDDLEADLDALEEGTNDHAVAAARLDRLHYQRNGLVWQRDEEGWGENAEIELGAMTTGENALMHREAPDNAGSDEMRIWFVAASTESAPYVADDLSATFANLSGAHPAFVQWAESKANSLGVAGEMGNASSTSSTETEASETSTETPNTSTTSSSDSPTE